jgi:hypothetical protein
MSRASDTQCRRRRRPAPGPRVGHGPSSASSLGRPARRSPHRPGGRRRSRRAARAATPARPPGGVGDRFGVRHREDRGVAAGRGRRPGPSRPSRRPRAPARAGGCAGRPGPAGDQPSASTPARRPQDAPARGPGDRDDVRRRAAGRHALADEVLPADERPCQKLTGRIPSPAAGRARPCAPRRRCRPARRSPTGRVGDVGGDLHATVHRPGCRSIACSGRRRSRAVSSPYRGRTPAPTGRTIAHPLALHPQHHHRVGLGSTVVQLVGGGEPVGRARPDPDRQQGGWGDQGDAAPSRTAARTLERSDPAVQDVADDGDGRPSRSPSLARIV